MIITWMMYEPEESINDLGGSAVRSGVSLGRRKLGGGVGRYTLIGSEEAVEAFLPTLQDWRTRSLDSGGES